MATPPSPEYTSQLKDVISSEQAYLFARRQQYGVQRPADNPQSVQDPWGLCISGGGIRSATLGLGMLQKLVVEGLLKQVDYLSTVSGGGYIGSCLSTLMNTPADKYARPAEVVARQGQEAIPGMDPQTNPLVGLIETEPTAPPPLTRTRYIPGQLEPEHPQDTPAAAGSPGSPREPVLTYKPAAETRLDVRHQIHHLRTHGEYLTPDKSLLSPDVQRAVGTIVAGILHNLFLFLLALTMLVSIHYIGLDYLSDGDFIATMQSAQMDTPGQAAEEDLSIVAELGTYWSDRLMVDMKSLFQAWMRYPLGTLGIGLVGFLLGAWFFGRSRRIAEQVFAQQNAYAHGNLDSAASSGHTLEDYVQRRFIGRYNLLTLFGGIVLALGGWLVARALGTFDGDEKAYWLIFSLPVSLATGNFLAVFLLTALRASYTSQRRLHRAFFGGLRGGAFFALVFSLFIPLLILLLFSFSYYFDQLLYSVVSSASSVASILVGYLVAMSQQKESSSSVISKIMRSLQTPLLSLSVLLFVVLAASAIARILAWQPEFGGTTYYFPGWLLGASFAIFVLIGMLVNSNRLSLHYFYRDRLSETYLRTDGRALRSSRDLQGMPLVNLRDDENLRLKDLGWRKLSEEEKAALGDQRRPDYRYDAKGDVWAPNARGPYHLIVTALNLQGSDELVRKDLKSEHFIFSRNYVGSPSTGYVRTDKYRNGLTKLARAMTISAAAVSSGMGFSTFFAQSFLTTLLNLRLGYWIENPWYYRPMCQGRKVTSRAERLRLRLEGWRPKPDDPTGQLMVYNPQWRFTFWPFYLLKELLGSSNASTRLVNVSDGGHTGDNLGLLPLLRRRCRYIIVGDFEQDNAFSFASFNHAVRMANIEENIDIRIDLRDLMPAEADEKHIHLSPRSVAIGHIGYPDGTKGLLIYMKSSLSHEPLPVNVYNYHKMFPDFPHQSTADQYFDDAQFEAYRALGFHIGGEAAREIHKLRQ
ncbi:MAG: hypothetical protein D6722_28635 [Bacteroidetes bacterium]|nr:MAG: hypothetical protein D6722_28635 [Bacteroidota bacterium]